MDKADGFYNGREKIHSVLTQEKEKKRRKKKDQTKEVGRKEIKADESKSVKRRPPTKSWRSKATKSCRTKAKKEACKSRKAEKEKSESKRESKSISNRDGPALYASSSAITLRAILQPIGETLTQISMRLLDVANGINNKLEASRPSEVCAVNDELLGEKESVKIAQGVGDKSCAQDFLSSLTQKNVVLFSKCGINVDDVNMDDMDDRGVEINNNRTESCGDDNKIGEN